MRPTYEFAFLHAYFREEDNRACGEVVSRYGECSITEYVFPECDPSCNDEEMCIWSEDCATSCVEREWPYIDVGSLAVEGASYVDGITIDFIYIWSSDEAVWDAGDVLVFSAPGNEGFPAFVATTSVPEPIEVLTDLNALTAAHFDGDSSLVIEWIPEGGDAVQVSVESDPDVDVDFDETSLICNDIDDGYLEIPGDGIAGLDLANELSVSINRYNVTETHIGDNAVVRAYVREWEPTRRIPIVD
jgi:hypothetical protein